MEQQIPMFQENGLQMPRRVQKRFSSEELAKTSRRQVRENNKTRTLYIYSTVACHMWEFLRHELDLQAMCAPIVIDRNTGTRIPVLFEDGRPTTWMIGAFNTAAFNSQLGEDNKLYVPLDYEIRIFHENVLREIHSMYGKHPIEHEIFLTMSHVFTHEMCHYIMLLKRYNDTLHGGTESNLDLTNYLLISGGREMEYATEELAIRMLTRYWLTDSYHLRDIGDPVLGGPYDQWRCKNDDEWAITSMYLRVRKLINEETLSNGSTDNSDEYYDLLNKIDVITAKHREEARPFALID